MPEYKLIVNEDGAQIFNEEGQAVDTEAVFTLLDLLNERYEHPACVYVLHNAVMKAYKIGWTSQRIEARVSQIRYDVGDWQGVGLEFEISCRSSTEARRLEAELHTRFSHKNVYGEWFNLSDEDVDHLWEMAPGILPIVRKLEKLRKPHPSMHSLEDKAAILGYAAQVQAWLDRLVAEAKS